MFQFLIAGIGLIAVCIIPLIIIACGALNGIYSLIKTAVENYKKREKERHDRIRNKKKLSEESKRDPKAPPTDEELKVTSSSAGWFFFCYVMVWITVPFWVPYVIGTIIRMNFHDGFGLAVAILMVTGPVSVPICAVIGMTTASAFYNMIMENKHPNMTEQQKGHYLSDTAGTFIVGSMMAFRDNNKSKKD